MAGRAWTREPEGHIAVAAVGVVDRLGRVGLLFSGSDFPGGI